MTEKNIPEELTTEDLTFAAHDKVDALIDLLIKKDLFTEKEYLDTLIHLYDEPEDDSEDESEVSSEDVDHK